VRDPSGSISLSNGHYVGFLAPCSEEPPSSWEQLEAVSLRSLKISQHFTVLGCKSGPIPTLVIASRLRKCPELLRPKTTLHSPPNCCRLLLFIAQPYPGRDGTPGDAPAAPQLALPLRAPHPALVCLWHSHPRGWGLQCYEICVHLTCTVLH